MEEMKNVIEVEYEELLPDAPRDINTITTEILMLKSQAGEAILEIGRRLIEVKAQLDHGEWLGYLRDRVDVSVRTAQDMMRLAKEYSSNTQTFAHLGPQKALKLLTLPPSEREEFAAENDLSEMSVRQLDEAIKAQKAAEKERDYWQGQAAGAARELQEQLNEQQCVYDTDMAAASMKLAASEARAAELGDKLKKLENAPRSADPQELEAARREGADKAREAEAKKLKKQIEEAAASARRADEERAAYEQTARRAEQEKAALAAQMEELRRRLAMAGSDMAVFRVHFETMQDSANKMLECIAKADETGNPEMAEKMRSAARGCCQAVIAETEVRGTCR